MDFLLFHSPGFLAGALNFILGFIISVFVLTPIVAVVLHAKAGIAPTGKGKGK